MDETVPVSRVVVLPDQVKKSIDDSTQRTNHFYTNDDSTLVTVDYFSVSFLVVAKPLKA